MFTGVGEVGVVSVYVYDNTCWVLLYCFLVYVVVPPCTVVGIVDLWILQQALVCLSCQSGPVREEDIHSCGRTFK